MNQSELDTCPQPDYPTDVLSKVCTICKKLLPLSEYAKAKGGRDGKRARCKFCARRLIYIQKFGEDAYKRFENRESFRNWKILRGLRVCTKCKLTLPVDCFFKNAAKPDGRFIYCKRCLSEGKKAERRSKYTSEQLEDMDYLSGLKAQGKRRCRVCGVVGPVGDFIYNQPLCRLCKKSQWKRVSAVEIPKRKLKYAAKYRVDPLPRLFTSAKTRARVKGWEFNLTKEYLKSLWDDCNGACSVSGIPFVIEVSSADFLKNPFKPSLDRIDSKKGYVEGNVRWVIWGLNVAMNEYGLEMYLGIARAVVAKQDKGNLVPA